MEYLIKFLDNLFMFDKNRNSINDVQQNFYKIKIFSIFLNIIALIILFSAVVRLFYFNFSIFTVISIPLTLTTSLVLLYIANDMNQLVQQATSVKNGWLYFLRKISQKS